MRPCPSSCSAPHQAEAAPRITWSWLRGRLPVEGRPEVGDLTTSGASQARQGRPGSSLQHSAPVHLAAAPCSPRPLPDTAPGRMRACVAGSLGESPPRKEHRTFCSPSAISLPLRGRGTSLPPPPALFFFSLVISSKGNATLESRAHYFPASIFLFLPKRVLLLPRA